MVQEASDEPHAFGYLLELDFDVDGVHIRYGMDVTGCVRNEYREALKEAHIQGLAAARVGVTASAAAMTRKAIGNIIKRDKLEGALGRAGMMFMRARLTGGSLYLLMFSEPKTFDEIEKILAARHKIGDLKRILDQSRVA